MTKTDLLGDLTGFIMKQLFIIFIFISFTTSLNCLASSKEPASEETVRAELWFPMFNLFKRMDQLMPTFEDRMPKFQVYTNAYYRDIADSMPSLSSQSTAGSAASSRRSSIIEEEVGEDDSLLCQPCIFSGNGAQGSSCDSVESQESDLAFTPPLCARKELIPGVSPPRRKRLKLDESKIFDIGRLSDHEIRIQLNSHIANLAFRWVNARYALSDRKSLAKQLEKLIKEATPARASHQEAMAERLYFIGREFDRFTNKFQETTGEVTEPESRYGREIIYLASSWQLLGTILKNSLYTSRFYPMQVEISKIVEQTQNTFTFSLFKIANASESLEASPELKDFIWEMTENFFYASEYIYLLKDRAHLLEKDAKHRKKRLRALTEKSDYIKHLEFEEEEEE